MRSGNLSGPAGNLSGKRFPPCSTVSACPLCAQREACVLSQRARDGSALTTALCLECGLARTDPMPTEVELAAYYRDEYRTEYKGIRVPKKKHVLRAARLARERLDALAPRLAPGAKVLDVGAGGGEFVHLAVESGFAARGIEPNAGYAGYAHESLGLDVQPGTWQRYEADEGSLDAVTMFHVLEHLPDPLGCLRRMHDWLRPGGVLLVEVPNLLPEAGNPANRFHRAHLVHFTAETLTMALQLAGFEVLSCEPSREKANVLAAGRKAAAEGTRTVATANPAGVESALHWERSRATNPYLHPRAWFRFARKAAGSVEEMLSANTYRSRRRILGAVASRRPPKAASAGPSR